MLNVMRVLCFVFLASFASHSISAVPMVSPNVEASIAYRGDLQRIDLVNRLVSVNGVTYYMDANFDTVRNEGQRLFSLDVNAVEIGSKVGVEVYKGNIRRLHVFE